MAISMSASATSPSLQLDTPTAFAAIAVAAVAWDGVLTMAGTRALRHCLDYRKPYRELTDGEMMDLMQRLLAMLRQRGSQQLIVQAAAVLSPGQRTTAYAAASEIMRSDGPLEPDERNILRNLASCLELTESDTAPVQAVMDLLHADLET
jgi:tellurite resistance protein